MKHSEYRQNLIDRFWEYQVEYLADTGLFEKCREENPERPPVFNKDSADLNILLPENCSQDYRQSVLSLVGKRHRWFRSMSSSQALAQSIFGNLYALGKLNLLADLKGDGGKPLFLRNGVNNFDFKIENEVDYELFNEPRKTSLDVYFEYPDYKIAVECKFTEQEIGSCSRPRISKKAANYYRDYCNGKFEIQNERSNSCSLTERGIKYWDYIPELFNWDINENREECDLRYTYQLVRNVLAACIKDGKANMNNGHAVLVYDERNPEFQDGGKCWKAFDKTKESLKNPDLLQKCTWQQIINAITQDPDLDWLVKSIREKYGIQ